MGWARWVRRFALQADSEGIVTPTLHQTFVHASVVEMDIHVRLRISCREDCEFDSRRGYQITNVS
jgi:hypothetical protein